MVKKSGNLCFEQMRNSTNHLTRASWMVAVRAWPRWSWPVTFGGGSKTENVFRSDFSRSTFEDFDFPTFTFEEKLPPSFHHLYQPSSTWVASYTSGNGELTSEKLFNCISKGVCLNQNFYLIYLLRQLKTGKIFFSIFSIPFGRSCVFGVLKFAEVESDLFKLKLLFGLLSELHFHFKWQPKFLPKNCDILNFWKIFFLIFFICLFFIFRKLGPI